MSMSSLEDRVYKINSPFCDVTCARLAVKEWTNIIPDETDISIGLRNDIHRSFQKEGGRVALSFTRLEINVWVEMEEIDR
jgi:hypothetical protein